jgi:hypothetical protein
MVDSLIETENCGKFQPELGLPCGQPYQHEVCWVTLEVGSLWADAFVTWKPGNVNSGGLFNHNFMNWYAIREYHSIMPDTDSTQRSPDSTRHFESCFLETPRPPSFIDMFPPTDQPKKRRVLNCSRVRLSYSSLRCFFLSVPASLFISIIRSDWRATVSYEHDQHTSNRRRSSSQRTRTFSSPLSAHIFGLRCLSRIIDNNRPGTWLSLRTHMLRPNILQISPLSRDVHSLWIGLLRCELFKYPTLLSPLNKYCRSATNISNHSPLSWILEKSYSLVRFRVTPSESGEGWPLWYNSWRYFCGKRQWYNWNEVYWMYMT